MICSDTGIGISLIYKKWNYFSSVDAADSLIREEATLLFVALLFRQENIALRRLHGDITFANINIRCN